MNKPTILILDDNLERHQFFKSQYKEYNYVEAHNAYEAIQFLKDEKIDILSLDYDLYELPSPEPYLTGMAVVEFILDPVKFDPDCRPKKIIIHSMNLKGAVTMQRTFRENGIRVVMEPFPIEKMEWWEKDV